MNTTEIQGFRERLLTLGAQLKGDMVAISGEALRSSGGEGSGGLSNAPLHLADLATDAFGQEVAMGLLENERQALADIAAALERIDSGDFGTCEECGQEIPRGRLEALPFASRCVGCARRAENDGEISLASVGGPR